MTTVVYNGRPVRISFENGTLYFVWIDMAKAIGMPNTVVRRIQKTVYEFEKKNLRGARVDGATTRILAINYAGLYRWVNENDQIPEKQKLKDWVVRTYSEQGAKLNARTKQSADPVRADEDVPEEVEERLFEPSQTQKADDAVSDADLFRLAQKNIDIISKLIERHIRTDEQ